MTSGDPTIVIGAKEIATIFGISTSELEDKIAPIVYNGDLAANDCIVAGSISNDNGLEVKALSGSNPYRINTVLIRLFQYSISQYSTSETNTSKTWINGKPIYRRVIQFGLVPTGENRYDLNFSYETMISAIFMGGGKDGSSFKILPAYPNDTYWRTDATLAATQIVTRIGSSHGSTYITGIFEYTKKQ